MENEKDKQVSTTNVDNYNIKNNKIAYGILSFYNIFFVVKTIILTIFGIFIFKELTQEIPIFNEIPMYMLLIFIVIFSPIFLFYLFRIIVYIIGILCHFRKKEIATSFGIATAIMFFLEYITTILMTMTSSFSLFLSNVFFYVIFVGFFYILIPSINIFVMFYVIYLFIKKEK